MLMTSTHIDLTAEAPFGSAPIDALRVGAQRAANQYAGRLACSGDPARLG